MISQLAQFGARRGRIRHPDRSFWKQKRRCLIILIALYKGGARRTQSRARSSFAEPQPTLAACIPNTSAKLRKNLETYNL